MKDIRVPVDLRFDEFRIGRDGFSALEQVIGFVLEQLCKSGVGLDLIGGDAITASVDRRLRVGIDLARCATISCLSRVSSGR